MDKEKENDSKFNLDLLKDEYLMVQDFYQDIDRRCFTIMGWSITVAMAAIGAGIVYNQPVLLLVAFLAALMFWYLEATWRGLGHFMSVRINQIEDAVEQGKGGILLPLQLYSEWDKEFTKSGSQTRISFFKSLTAMPHIFIAVVSLALFIAVSAGWIELAIVI
jgi:hypothetical protein